MTLKSPTCMVDNSMKGKLPAFIRACCHGKLVDLLYLPLDSNFRGFWRGQAWTQAGTHMRAKKCNRIPSNEATGLESGDPMVSK